jgi:hypothetical protein
MGWARRLKREFAIDIKKCERCGNTWGLGQLRMPSTW